MRGPVVSVSCLERPRPGREPDLAARLRAASEAAGLVAWVTPADGTDGAVVVLEVSAGDLGLRSVDDSDGWAALSERLGSLLDVAAPALALGGFHPVLSLDEPVWRPDRLEWCSGRAQVDALDLDQRHAFNLLVDRRLVEVRDTAVRWATRPGVPLGVRALDVHPLGLAAATFEAWTGEAADPTPPKVHVDLEDVNAPTLWLWSPDDSRALATRIATALPAYEVSVQDDYAPVAVVVADPRDPRRGLEDLLGDLRAVVAQTGPAWAGLLPRGGFLPPGVSPETPGASLVDHLWLDEQWAGRTLDDIGAALDRAVPERVGTGTLFATGDPDHRAGDLLWTPMVRYARLSEAAQILGRRVRQDIDGPQIRL